MAEQNDDVKLIKKIKLGEFTYDIAATQVDASAVQFGEGNKLNSEAISGVSADNIIWTNATGKIPESAISGISASKIQWTDADGNVPESNQIPEDAISSVPASALTDTDILAENIIWTSGEGGTEGYVPVPTQSITSVQWSTISGLTGNISTATSTGFAAPSAVANAIANAITNVYKFQGTHKVENADVDEKHVLQPATMPDSVNGDVYNMDLSDTGLGYVILNGQTITDGDNVAFVVDDPETGTGHWDKLAGSIDTSTIADKEWVESYVSGGEKGENVREKFDSLWNAVSSYIDDEVTSANAGALWENIETAITSSIDTKVWDEVITAASDLSAITPATSGKLVNAGALSSYIDDKIESTIQETIDIANYDTTKSAFVDSKGNFAPASAVPNAGAVSSFVEHQYIHKNDITYSDETQTLIIDNLF